jgi:hypothetical protein
MVGDWNVYPKVYTQLRPFIVKNWSHDMFYKCTQQVFLNLNYNIRIIFHRSVIYFNLKI